MGMELQHKWPLAVLIVAQIVTLVITIIFNGIVSVNVVPGVFLSTTGDVSDKYYLEITPAGWTFSIWGFIYTAQAIFCAYIISLICRKGPDNYLYQSPQGMIPNAVYILYMITNLGNIVWIILWDRELLVASLVIIALMAAMLILATGFAAYGLVHTSEELKLNNNNAEIWLNRTMVQNAISFYGTWVSIATLLNLGMVLTYFIGVPQPDSSTVCLSLLLADLLIWFVCDTFVFYRYTNYIVMPYVVVIVALAGSLDKNFVAWNRNSTFSVILIILAVAAFTVKIIVMLWRHFRMRPSTPLVSPNMEKA